MGMKMGMMGVPGNLGIPNLMGIVPGMTAFSTSLMKKKMAEVGESVAPIPPGVNISVCCGRLGSAAGSASAMRSTRGAACSTG